MHPEITLNESITQSWQIPNHDVLEFKPKKFPMCVCIPVINEGERIQSQLAQMEKVGISSHVDIILCDGGSTDNSVNPDFLKKMDVRTLLIKTGTGKLSAQLRMGYAYALTQGYRGIITIDGNNKDNVEAILQIKSKLEEGYDFIQGSRYIKGGIEINTPMIRKISCKLIHIPIISLKGNWKYTDTTNGFRGYSHKFLLDPEVQPFREVFATYELLAYLSVRAPQLGYRVVEIPVVRRYPETGSTPTKISAFRGNFDLLKILWSIILNKYNPKKG